MHYCLPQQNLLLDHSFIPESQGPPSCRGAHHNAEALYNRKVLVQETGETERDAAGIDVEQHRC